MSALKDAHRDALGLGSRVALKRLSMAPDGRLVYRIKEPRGGSLWLLLTPDELMARLAILVPPPRVHAVRYHGVFAPNAKVRRQVVPAPEEHVRGGRARVPGLRRGDEAHRVRRGDHGAADPWSTSDSTRRARRSPARRRPRSSSIPGRTTTVPRRLSQPNLEGSSAVSASRRYSFALTYLARIIFAAVWYPTPSS